MVEGSGVKVEMPDEAESSVTLRVLLVEDDPFQQMALSGIIARVEAENAQLTVQLIQVICQLPRALTPVLLSGEARELGEPWLRANACRRRTEKRIKNLALNAQQIVIALDEPLLVAAHAFAQRCTATPVAPRGGAAAAGARADGLLVSNLVSDPLRPSGAA